MSELSKEHGEAVGSGRMKQARRAVTQFRGVRPKRNGRYGAQIWDPSRRGMLWLGTFDTAEDAAKAYDAAAVKLHAGAGGLALKKKAAARPDAWCEFRGVQRTLSGKYRAQIGHSTGKARTWLGTFNVAKDAARAYDAAAVKLHGARAITNFKQPSEDKDATSVTIAVTPSGKYGAQIGQWKRKARTTLPGTVGSVEDAAKACDTAALKLYGAAAKPNFEQPPAGATADVDGEESSMGLLNDFQEMSVLDFLDLCADLPPAERQLVDGFLKDADFSDVLS